jgi:hypothetical protein
MPGSIVVCAVSCRLCRVNFEGQVLPICKAKTEAFRASGGLNASRIQVVLKRLINEIKGDVFEVVFRM